MKDDLYPSRSSTQPRTYERKDPVFYGKGTSNCPISSQDLQGYIENGVMVLEDMFSAEEVASLQTAANSMRQNANTLQAETVVTEPSAERNDIVRSVFAIHQQSDVFANIAASERLSDIARFILNDDVYIHQSRLNYKPGFHGKEFYWHSDFETWHVEDGMPRMRALSMSVMLTDNHSQAGPTMFVSGSHNSFVSCTGETPDENYKKSLKKQEVGVPDADILTHMVETGNIIAPTPPAGSVVIFDCNTMHGSNGNITPLERTNAFFVYNAWSNRLTTPYGGTKERPEFIAHRLVDRPLVAASKKSIQAA
ncbi:ectoine hydroxylase [Hirschia litorea]|uniref:Ectoine hydroxylase n=1 Tax=Hirschia litorea TaxID=1199156 RepID=A0ABW2IP05_9PROT